ncbi:MAG: hypothetical protein A2X36_14140 [Elusimicrobia bacterium GWA2_69_24]|nr:MAG: hypothetical protein A2X36_14140 [Elusimicrobia bacterium GWA2_69_24]HBL18908.1 hypothetical protein [Elusimicrobiota bacterium]
MPIARILALTALFATAALPAAAQGSEEKRREVVSAEVSEEFQALKMPQELKDKLEERIIDTIMGKVQGVRARKIRDVDIVYKEGATTEKLVKGHSYDPEDRTLTYNGKKYQVIELEQDLPNIPETKTKTTNPIQLNNFGNLFNDNEWTPDGPSRDALRNSLAKIKDTLKASKGKIISIMIKSSASTLKNTGAAEAKTHHRLALDRAEAAQAFILEQLGDYAKGAKVLINADGDTYDKAQPATAGSRGTSGPGSPYPCPQGTDPKFCPPGDDQGMDAFCAGGGAVSVDDSGAACSAPASDEAEADPAAWDFGQSPEIDCERWKAVKALRAKPHASWTPADKATVQGFYAPFKYVYVKMEALNETVSAAGQKGQAHMVLAVVELDQGGSHWRPRFKTRFKPVKAKVKKRSLWEKWQASRRTKRECKNASFR